MSLLPSTASVNRLRALSSRFQIGEFRRFFLLSIVSYFLLVMVGEAFGASPTNISSSASATCSSQRSGSNQTCNKAIDGVADGWPGDFTREWATRKQGVGAWIQLDWASAQQVDHIVLYDRPNSNDQVLAGTLSFSDGSSVSVGALANTGTGQNITFASRNITWVRFTVNSVAAGTVNVGLSEFEVYDVAAGGGNTAPTIDAGPVASPATILETATSQLSVTASDVDGDTLSYVWTPASGSISGTGATVTFTPAPVTADTVVRITVTVRDPGGLSATGFVDVTVQDTTATGVGSNIASQASATCSSQRSGSNQTCIKAIDRVADGWPGDFTREWATFKQGAGAWIQLDWASAQQVDRVVLYDRPNDVDQVLSGTLSFSDGSTVSVGALGNTGAAQNITFVSRNITWVRFTVNSVAVGSVNIGLSEFEVYDVAAGGGNTAPTIDAGPVASPVTILETATSQLSVTASDVDGDTLSYVWTPASGSISGTGATVTFTPAPVAADAVVRITVTVQDPGGLSATGFVDVTVTDTGAPGGGSNIAPLASATCSSQRSGSNQTCNKAIDGVADGWPGDFTREWATRKQGVGAWIQLDWASAQQVDRVVLYDRPNDIDQVLAGTLSFSDGSTVSVGALANTGAGQNITFASRDITWVRFTVNSVAAGTVNVGLSEFEVFSGTASGVLFNEALYATPQASSGGATAEAAIDSVSGVANNAWIASAAGDSLTLNFDTTKSITQVVLMDRVSATDNVLQATVMFSNGDSFLTGALPAAGGPVNFNFPPKNVDWVKVTLDNVVGANPGLGEFETYSLLDQQSIQNQEQFTIINGAAPDWVITDNGSGNGGVSNWSVLNDEYVQSSGILGQTADGFEIGTYAVWSTVTHNAMDLRVRLRNDGIGVIGVMFGYQDDSNYYRFSLSQREGYQKLEKKQAGIFTELATSPQSYTVGAWTNIRIVLQNGVIVAFVDGEQVMAAADASFASGQLGLWASRNISASSSYDKVILLSAPSKPVIGLGQPGEFFVKTGTLLDVSAVTTQSVGGVEFVVDEGMAGSQTDTVLGAPFTTQFSFAGVGEHTVNAYALDGTATRLSHVDAQDTLIQVGISGIHLVGFGDSITDGVGDDNPADDVSSDGRNTSGGYEPILNNTLTAASSKPVTAIDEGNPSDRATDGEGKIAAVLARTPEAQAYLIMFGTNDAGGSLPALDTDFKASLKTIVDAVLAAGKLAYIAKPPLRVGQASRNALIEGYNVQIDALISDYALTNPGVVFAGPDFYTYFTANQGEIGPDNLHPNGVGYQSMGQQWSNVVDIQL